MASEHGKERMNILDVLKQSRRMPQIILPKDAAMIVAYTGVSGGWDVLDSGTGSGFLSMFIANIVRPGKVTSYEVNGAYARNAQENAKRAGISNLEIINKDIFEASLKGKYDLITLDLKNSDRLINKVYKALKKGGWLAVYSPQIEQAKAVRKEMEAKELQFTDITTIENIVREWQVTDEYTHPVPSGLVHTGFLTFGRKSQ
jgi:tRNA (adenine57-N1/adenine58-N1)-methyltransferase